MNQNSNWKKPILSIIGPGLLVAATGVGAGDLLTASLGGSAVGVVIIWAALIGAFFKWVLNEGIARWQMATGTTILEGWVRCLGKWIRWIFFIYLIAWTFLTGGALVNACGVAGTGLLQLTQNPEISKILWGIFHSILGLVLVWCGGYGLFEKMMSICIGIMFVSVLTTAVLIGPDLQTLFQNLLIPRIPPGGTGWVLGILGGVGGTLTLLSYGYWIREKNREGIEGLKVSRVDLAVGYFVTALFGMAMIIIGSRVEIQGSGVQIAPILANQLGQFVKLGRTLFLVGFWGAVFSSLLGVWQSVPYLFTDFIYLAQKEKNRSILSLDFTNTRPYRLYLIGISILTLPLLWFSVKKVQLIYAIFGSFFMPLLALTLFIMNNKKKWVGEKFRSPWLINGVLIMILLFFLYMSVIQIVGKMSLLLKGQF